MEATLSTSQMICSRCEELVHRYAARCPYCQHDLTAPLVAMAELHFEQALNSFKDSTEQSDLSASKITPLNQDIPQKLPSTQSIAVKSSNTTATPNATMPLKQVTAAKQQAALPTFDSLQVEQKPQPATGITQESLVKVLFSLIALLGGSFFAFFGLMLKLFSKNGKLVLEWNAETWPYYLFPALVLLVLGMAMLPSSEQETI